MVCCIGSIYEAVLLLKDVKFSLEAGVIVGL